MEQELLNKICWSFSNKKYDSLEKFNAKVAQYNKDILEEKSSWNSDQIVYVSDKIAIYFEAWLTGPEVILENEELLEDEDFFEDEDNADDGYFQTEMVMHLQADNNKYFTAGELLFKIHNQLANKELGDHVFFEGLQRDQEHEKSFYMYCGS